MSFVNFKRNLLLSAIGGAILYTNTAHAGNYEHLAVNVYTQDDRCWCSIAVLEMWSDWLNGITSKQVGRQATLAQTYSVGAFDTKKNQCPTRDGFGGLNANQLADALEDETSNWFSRYKTASKDDFASKIVKEIHDKTPAAVVGYTNFKDGKSVPNQHYYLVDAFENTTKDYSSQAKNISGFYLNDPAYNAPNLGHVKSISPRTFVSKETFFKSVASISDGKYYLVED